MRVGLIEKQTATRELTKREVSAYLYRNFELAEIGEYFVIYGNDNAGFTFDALRDRYASGLIALKELK